MLLLEEEAQGNCKGMKNLLIIPLFLLSSIVMAQDIFKKNLYSADQIMEAREKINLTDAQATKIKKIHAENAGEFSTLKWDLDEANAKLEKMLQQLESSWKDDQERLAGEKLAADQCLVELRDRRSAISVNIDSQSLFIYDRVRLKRKGQAVARVERGICQGCNITLPTNTVKQARMQEFLMQCPSCTRLLYVI